MARLICLATLVVLMGVVGCSSENPPPPAVDVQATVDAAVQATVAGFDLEATTAPAVEPAATAAPTSTPLPPATPTSTPAPVATATPTPAPTPTPADPLETTDRAHMWVYILGEERSYGGTWWEVYADPAFDVDTYDLSVFINGKEFCNTNAIYGDLGQVELSCAGYEPQGAIQMYATVGASFTSRGEVLECAQNKASRPPNRLVFACRARGN